MSQPNFLSVIKNWPDFEVKAIDDHINRFDNPAKAREDQQVRKGKVDAGIFKAQSELPAAIHDNLRDIDPMTRLRWDYDAEAWAVDRAIEQYGAWFPVFFWVGPWYGDEGMFTAMRKGDMQKFKDPAEYLRQKREEAKKKREENDKAQTDKMRGIIDGLSDRQVDQFIKVEQALASGEKIHVRGDDAVTLQYMYEQTKKRDGQVAQAKHEIDTATSKEKEMMAGEYGDAAMSLEEAGKSGRSNAINPGMRPHQYNRSEPEKYEKAKGGEI